MDTAGDQISEMSGEFVGDKLKELTGNKEMAQFTGKLAEKGLEKLTDYAIDKAKDKIFAANGTINTNETIQSQQVNYEIRLLGILKAKKTSCFRASLKCPSSSILVYLISIIPPPR